MDIREHGGAGSEAPSRGPGDEAPGMGEAPEKQKITGSSAAALAGLRG